jgi:hypothetical protein
LLLLFTVTALAATSQVEPGADLSGYVNGMLPGDVLELADGVYPLELGLDIVSAGTEDAPIVIRAAPGATPVLALSGSDYAIDIQGTEFIQVKGLTLQGPPEPADGFWSGGLRVLSSRGIRIDTLTVTGFTGTGLRVEGDCRDVELVGNAVLDMPGGHGIEVGCWDASCWLERGQIRRNWIGRLTGEGAHGVLLHHGSQDISVADNVLAHLAFRGITAGSTEYGEPNRIEGNALWEIGEHGIFVQGAARVRNNVVLTVGGSAIRTADDPARRSLGDVVIAYNTVADSGDWTVYLEDWPDAQGMVLSSNVIANPFSFGLWYPDVPARDFTANRLVANVVTGAADLPQSRFVGAVIEGEGYDDFASFEGRDLYPAPQATMLDAGERSAESGLPPLDFNGVPRDGTAPDAGAYSYLGDGNPGWALTEGFKALGYAEEDRTVDLGGGCCSGGDGSKAWIGLALLPLALRRRRQRVHPRQ